MSIFRGRGIKNVVKKLENLFKFLFLILDIISNFSVNLFASIQNLNFTNEKELVVQHLILTIISCKIKLKFFDIETVINRKKLLLDRLIIL